MPTPDRSVHWWEAEPTRIQRLHGIKRPKRAKITNKAPSWTIVIMMVALVLIVGGLLIATMDFREGRLVSVWSPSPTSTPLASPSYSHPSPDMVKAKLQRHGFKVDFLSTTTDPKLLAYDTAETYIDGTPVMILVFKDQKTTQKWIEGSDVPAAYAKLWVVAADDLQLMNNVSAKLEVDLHD